LQINRSSANRQARLFGKKGLALLNPTENAIESLSNSHGDSSPDDVR
jgi:hypothetical protein